MQVTKVRIALGSGLVPAGAYFTRLADNLRTASLREAAAIEKAEARERKLEARYRGARAAPPPRTSFEHHAVV